MTVGELDPLKSFKSSLGDRGDPPFSMVLLEAGAGMSEILFCTPQILSKSGLVPSGVSNNIEEGEETTDHRTSFIRNETAEVSHY